MKIIISIIAIIILLFIIFKVLNKKKQDTTNDIEHEAWVSTKKASDRISSENITNKNYASNKLEVPESKKSDRLNDLINQGNKALSDLDRLRNVITNTCVVEKINSIYDITVKIMKDAIDDPDDIPQIKRFFNYYLPTTIKLLNSYLKLQNNDILTDNVVKTKEDIEQMLDVVIKANTKRLNSLFENQAMDIESDIEVMNQLLAQEGLISYQKNQTMEGNK